MLIMRQSSLATQSWVRADRAIGEKRMLFKIFNPFFVSFAMGGTVAVGVLAQQPESTVPMTNRPCDTGPRLVGGKPDTLRSEPDAEGFFSLFDGKSLTGWWEHCNNFHANQDRTNGGIWIADSNQGILYSKQNTNGAGGLLATNKSFDHYELTFEFWPTFGNDAGLFNRVSSDGKTWQTGLDYISGSGIGGSYSENGWSPTAINDDPFRFGNTFENPTITTWTTFTSSQSPTSFGCSAGGCNASDFIKIWNPNGWNQLRVKFYGGLTPGSQVNMETWLRKVQNPVVSWVPVYKSSKSVTTPAGPIAFQIHGGTEKWKSGGINLYRNIKVRPLQSDGSPIMPVGITKRHSAGQLRHPDIAIVGDRMKGRVHFQSEIAVRNIQGVQLLRFNLQAGQFEQVLPKDAVGVLVIELKWQGGWDRMRISHVP